jgi:hypothetical protein
MRTATPDIVLPVRIPWWDIRLRLTRRITEISDGRLALRIHMDPAIDGPAQPSLGSSPADDEVQAAAEAARLHAAIAAKANNITVPQAADAADGTRGEDGISALAWLTAVSRAFTHPPGGIGQSPASPSLNPDLASIETEHPSPPATSDTGLTP